MDFTPLTDEELNEIEARANAATPAEWHAVTNDELHRIFAYDRFIDLGGIVRSEDAAFIARARTDVPRLVAEIARLRAKLEAQER